MLKFYFNNLSLTAKWKPCKIFFFNEKPTNTLTWKFSVFIYYKTLN